ncbi:unnamed protein product [Rhizoctonia solani]|uniref:AA1-like domain-containing protein n=1 Tax=Rhizoctonia solani TaxID=456999 RepID=A0A8H2W740_9AGAM|nr:unnamed protein product [Rhizoctonia solani]
MLFFPLSALLATTALAAPVKRDVPVQNCVKLTSGSLVGADGQQFSLSDDKTAVTYAGNNQTSFLVEFQSCDPNFTKYPNSGDGPYAGHIMVVSEQKCLEVPSYENYGSETYPLLLKDCYYSSDSGQFAFTFLKRGDDYYWSGATMSDGSLIQNGEQGCTDGLFGYKSGDNNALVDSGSVNVACASSAKAFKISQ